MLNFILDSFKGEIFDYKFWWPVLYGEELVIFQHIICPSSCFNYRVSKKTLVKEPLNLSLTIVFLLTLYVQSGKKTRPLDWSKYFDILTAVSNFLSRRLKEIITFFKPSLNFCETFLSWIYGCNPPSILFNIAY